MLVRIALTTLHGFLALLLVLYFLLPYISSVQPLSILDGLRWILAQNKDYIVAAAGVVAAYAVAVHTWREQKRSELCLAASGDIDRFFQGACAISRSLENYAEKAVELYDILHLHPDRNVSAECSSLRDAGARAWTERMQLSQLTVDVHSLRTRYDLVISRSALASICMDKSMGALDSIGRYMWYDIALNPRSELELKHHVYHGNKLKWSEFISVAKRANPIMIAGSTGLRAMFESRFLPPTLNSLRRMWKLSDDANKWFD